jgi:hypothetical protein
MNQDSEEQVPSTLALLASIKRIVKLHKHVNPGRGRPRPYQASDLRWS